MSTITTSQANAQMMRKHIASYEKSGMSVRAYCVAHGVDVPKFNYWYYKRHKKQGSFKTAVKGFSLVQTPDVSSITETPKKTAAVEITLANGTHICFHDTISLELFKALL